MGSRSTTTQNNQPYKPAQPLIDQGLQDARSMYDQGGFRVNPFGGDMVAGYDPFRQMADNASPGVFQGSLGMSGNAAGAANRAMDPSQWRQGLDGVRDNVIADVMPSINSTFGLSGMTGSDLHQQNLSRGLSSGLANAYFGAQQQSENRALQAAGMVPGLNASAYGAVDFMQGQGANRQGDQQDRINAEMMRDQQGQTAGMNALQDYMALVSGAGSAFGVQSSTQRQSPGLLGIAGLGLQAAPFLFSDRTLKTDIERVGKTDDGLPVYTYRYKAGGPVQMGVMAQDVQKVKPEAVARIGGKLAVNYGAI